MEAELERHLYSKTGDICAWVKAKFGVEYTRQGMTEWLHRHNYSWKTPVGIPAKADPQKQKNFKRAYARLKKNLPEDEVIVFADASHPTMATKIGKGWVKTGQARPIETIASRTRVNVQGSLDVTTGKFVGSFHKTINSQVMELHFKDLRQVYAQFSLIHVILDRSGYNTCQYTKDAAKRYGIKLHYLPPYSPNLNVIERLWKIASECVRKNRVFSSAKEFRDSMQEFFFETWPEISEIYRDTLTDKFQTLSRRFQPE